MRPRRHGKRARLPALARALSPIAVALAIAGCTVGPEFVKPAAPLNADWSNADKSQFAARAAADTAWWKTYNDPVLDSLIATAYQQNLSLQAAGIRIYEARAQLGIAIGR